jgi:GatB/GatE catalytic domain
MVVGRKNRLPTPSRGASASSASISKRTRQEHARRGRRAADSRIDLNRAGRPLLEIVTQRDLRSPADPPTPACRIQQ